MLYSAGGALVGARLLGLDEVARAAVQRPWPTWSFDSKLRACIWTQHVPGGDVGQSVGFAHGFAGNVFALLKAAPLQSREHQTELMHRVIETLERTALREGKLVNWPPVVGDASSKLRVQWCHGAPGIVCALAGAPAQRDLDAILIAAGELTWEAGPLRNSAWPMNGTQVRWLYKSPGPIVLDAFENLVFAGRTPTAVQGNQRYVVGRTSMPGSKVTGGGGGAG